MAETSASLLEQLRAENLTVPVMMLTTEGQLAMIDRAKRAGAKSWMVKPFNPDLLIKAVNKIAGAPDCEPSGSTATTSGATTVVCDNACIAIASRAADDGFASGCVARNCS